MNTSSITVQGKGGDVQTVSLEFHSWAFIVRHENTIMEVKVRTEDNTFFARANTGDYTYTLAEGSTPEEAATNVVMEALGLEEEHAATGLRDGSLLYGGGTDPEIQSCHTQRFQ